MAGRTGSSGPVRQGSTVPHVRRGIPWLVAGPDPYTRFARISSRAPRAILAAWSEMRSKLLMMSR